MPKRRRVEAADQETEASWEAPRGQLGGGSSADDHELLPVRKPDGQWQRRHTKAKQRPQPEADEEEHGDDGEAASDGGSQGEEESLQKIAAAVESDAAKRSNIAQLSAAILENPHKHVGQLKELLVYAKHRESSPTVQRLALLSAAAVMRDLIPAYRIRPPTEKELKMQVSKEVEALRTFESKFLTLYEQGVNALRNWLASHREAHRAAGVRGLCALLDKGYDFNHRETIIAALVPVANAPDADARGDACAALLRLYEHDTQGDATLLAVKEASNLLKHSSFNVQPELIGTWLHIPLDAAAASSSAEPSSRRAKKRKKTLDPVTRELAAAAGERGDLARMQSRILEHVFVSYARVVKRGAHSPLLPAVLRGVAKFAHHVNVELLLDLYANLRDLLSAGGLSDASSLMCVHALLQLLSGHGQALAVDAKEVQRVLYGLLARASLVSQPSMLATALDCVEHLCKRDRASLLAPRAASIVRRLLSLASTSPPGCAIALLCAASRLLVACPRIGTMFESPEGGGPNLAVLGGAAMPTVGGGVALEEGGADIDSPAAIHSTAWQLSELKVHYHPTVRELAAKLAAREPLPPKFLNATPLSLMNNYSDAHGAFHPAPTPPRPHRLAAAARAAAAKGAAAPTLGAVPSSTLEEVREAERRARERAPVQLS